MAGDLGRTFPLGAAGDHPADGAYRVNPAGKDHGRSAQERFRDNLERRKRKNAESDEPSVSDAEQKPEDAATSADAFLVEDRVNLSSINSPEQPPAEAVETSAEQQQGSKPAPEQGDASTQPAKPKAAEETKPPTGQSGRVDVLA